MINTIQQTFDKAADSYDAHCHAQQQAGIKLAHMLKSLQPTAKQILDLGCGTGITTEFLASQYSYNGFHALDIAPALLSKAHARLRSFDIKTYTMDFDHLSLPHHAFDIIYSNMALQWSKNLPVLFANAQSLLAENGKLAFSLPLTGTFQELQTHCAINALPNYQQIINLLTDCGYSLLTHATENIILRFTHPMQALKSIKHIGANYVYQRPHKGLHNKSYFKQMNANQLTYVIGYFVARR